jgi:hypothetical protein
MKRMLVVPLAMMAFCAAAQAADGPYRRPVVYAPQGTLTPDEIREYQMDQLESRQEMQRRALRLRQEAERRAIDPDADD